MTKDRESNWFRLILFMLAMLMIAVMYQVVPPLFPGELYASVATFVVLFGFLLMFIFSWAFVRWDGGDSVSDLGLDIDNRLVPHISMGAIAGALAVALVAGIAFFFGGQLRPLNEITVDLTFNVIFNAVLFSFFEELTHRGYILTSMENLVGRNAAIIFSSLFFSLIHFSWWIAVDFNIPLIILFSFNMFLGGVVLSLGYFWSGKRLWVPIAFHFMWNVLAYTLFPSFPDEGVTVIQPEIFQIEWGVMSIIGFLFGLSILWTFLASDKNKE